MTQSNKRTGHVDYTLMLAALLGTARDPMYRVLEELIANGFDALRQAENLKGLVEVTYDKAGDLIIVGDSGRGFLTTDIDSFLSVFLTGKKQGGTIGKWGFGRLFAFLFADSMRVISQSADYPDGVEFTLSKEEIISCLKTGKLEKVPKVGNLPADWPYKVSGAQIILTGIDWTALTVPRDTTVHGRLHLGLSPRMAGRTRFNGKKLKDRSILGTPIELEYKAAQLAELAGPFGGSAEIYLYMPETRTGQEVGGIWIGGYNRIMPLREFVRMLPENLRKLVPDVLLTSDLTGDILIPAVNNHRGNDSASLDKDIVDGGLAMDIVKFLSTTLGPEVAKQYEQRLEEKSASELAERLQGLCDTYNPNNFDPRKLGVKPLEGGTSLDRAEDETVDTDDDVDTWSISVTPKTMKLTPGDTQPILVRSSHGCSGKWGVETKACGGDVLRAGKGWQYTAGKGVGNWTLVVYDTAAKATRRVEVEIEIVAEAELAITPVSITIEQGKSRRFRVKHIAMLGGKRPEWNVLSNTEGIAIRRGCNNHHVDIQVPSECKPREYTLRCAAGDLQAEVTFVVIEPEDYPLILVIDGIAYKIRVPEILQPMFLKIVVDDHTEDGTVGYIDINPEHVCLIAMQKRPKSTRGSFWFDDYFLHEAVTAHVLRLVVEMEIPAEQAHAEIDRILTDLVTQS